ncbi:LLM class F420-dependent oxidoreductase [Nakamurella lactea]|uniref:LLM class F420-dependent oxidoreductase n=1 Tax=Nakamurella lactea TaxID=459515 RepID=UPI00048B2F95
MRFGIFVPQGWRMDLAGIDPADHWQTMSTLAKRADAGPWESIWVYDHFHTTPVPTEEATHEAWSLMSAFGAATERVRLGQMCTCMAYRNPAYLAKVAATVDIISGGRVEMGIGGGWYEHEWKAYGYGFPRAGVRLGMLDEGVQIMRQAWRDGIATLDGKYYQVDGAIVRPKPLQDGGIPLWIAGGGEKVTLRIAAQYAQYTNFAPGVFAEKSSILKQHCADVGTDFEAITRSANFNMAIAATEKEAQDRLDWAREHYTRYVNAERAEQIVNDLRNSPGFGTPEQVIEKMRVTVDQGMSYPISYFPEAAYDTSGIELYEKEVIPALAG